VAAFTFPTWFVPPSCEILPLQKITSQFGGKSSAKGVHTVHQSPVQFIHPHPSFEDVIKDNPIIRFIIIDIFRRQRLDLVIKVLLCTFFSSGFRGRLTFCAYKFPSFPFPDSLTTESLPSEITNKPINHNRFNLHHKHRPSSLQS
jgi:hypothetical protein